jgi:hypothetical protein
VFWLQDQASVLEVIDVFYYLASVNCPDLFNFFPLKFSNVHPTTLLLWPLNGAADDRNNEGVEMTK